ncbi:ABC transporter permease [Paenibacillus pinihumi]|uniref:ABC transporter permease n=1 Tax=Paenibacillus pinihumi TaxID=669462 RepID=UPI00041501F4|nr:ABC transporter permease [Paenibacillus pinihumi]
MPDTASGGKWLNRRQRAVIAAIASAMVLFAVLGFGLALPGSGLDARLEIRNQPPSLSHLFGTDWLGRDMLTRTLKGLTLSIFVGLAAAASSVLIAAIMGLAAAMGGRYMDHIIGWITDLFLSVPHLVTLILISFILGGGVKGVLIGIAVTHWPAMARMIRAELLQLRETDYVRLSSRLGRSRWWIATRHLLPHLLPHLLTGMLLIFPHAILHEASITFLGLGLSPHQPAIGIILSESMRYLSTGLWWLAFFPGAALLLIVRSFDRVSEYIRLLIHPASAQE